MKKIVLACRVACVKRKGRKNTECSQSCKQLHMVCMRGKEIGALEHLKKDGGG